MKGQVKQRGKSWYYRVDLPADPVTGERQQKYKGGFPTKKEAQKALAELLAKVSSGEFVKENSLTVAEFFQIWLKDYALAKYKPTVYDVEYSIVHNRIIPEIGRQKLQQIKPLTITQFYNKLAEKYSSDYVRHIHAIIRKAFRQAEKWELLQNNPMTKVDSPRLQKSEMKVWTLDQCLHFLRIAEGHVHYIVYSIAIHTGMRKGEVLGLRWKDIDFEAKTASVIQTVNWTPSKGIIIQRPKTERSTRRIAIGDVLIEDLRRRHDVVEALKAELGAIYNDNDLICCYENGDPIKPRRITETFEHLTNKADLPKIRFHDLRHSHATMLLQNNVNAKIGSERLGHSSVQIFLDRYAHLLPNMQREAIDGIDTVIKNKAENPIVH